MLPPLSWSTAEETPLRISKYSRYCHTFGGFQERTSSKVVFTLIVFIWTSGWQWARGEQPRCAEQGPRRPRQLWAGLPQGISSIKINLLHVYNCHNSVFVHKKNPVGTEGFYWLVFWNGGQSKKVLCKVIKKSYQIFPLCYILQVKNEFFSPKLQRTTKINNCAKLLLIWF